MRKIFITFLLILFCLSSSFNDINFVPSHEEPSIEIYSDTDQEHTTSDFKQ